MSFPNCIKFLMTILLISSNIFAQDPSLKIAPPKTDSEISIDEHNDILENQLKSLLSHYNSIDMILEDLAGVVNNGQIPKVKNKRILVEEILNIRGIIASVQKDAFVDVNPASLFLLNKILDNIIIHITKAVSLGFTSLPTFDLESCVKRSMQMEVDLGAFSEELAQTKKSLDLLDKKAKNAGLLWYNKVYRKLDDFVIQPCIKYRIPQRGSKIILASAIAFYFLWFRTERGTRPENEQKTNDTIAAENPQMLELAAEIKEHVADISAHMGNAATDKRVVQLNEKAAAWKSLYEQAQAQKVADYIASHPASSIKNGKYWSWEYWLRDKVGPYAHTKGSFGDLNDHFHGLNKNMLKSIGLVDNKIMHYNLGHMPLGALMLYYAPTMFGDEWARVKLWLNKKISAAHYKLKGGAFRKKADQGEAKIEPKITFDDLVGLDHIKQELSLIVRYIEDPERWDRGQLPPEKGYLLTGPTRTGKSYTAEALAGEIKKMLTKNGRNSDEFSFYVIKASTITQHGIGKVLELAKQEAPCVLFIDEIDLLGLQRTGQKEILHEFLTSLSGCLESDPKKQIIILAATNKPENMDEALKQRGRFGKQLRFEYPTSKDREKYLLKRMGNLAINLNNFDLDKLILESEGSSFEDLNAVVKRAFQQSKILRRPITQQFLDDAMDSEIRNIISDESRALPEKERAHLAIHQAGHVLSNFLLTTGQVVAKVTIRPVQYKMKEENPWDVYYKKDNEKQAPIEFGKMFTYHPHDTLNFNTREEKMNLCKVELAGHAAEEILLGSSGYSYHINDKQKALELAKSIIFEGIHVENLPKKMQTAMYDQAFELLNQCKKEVMELLEKNKDKLQKLSHALLKKQTMSKADIEALLKDPAPAGTIPGSVSLETRTNTGINKFGLGKKADPEDAKKIAAELGINELLPNPTLAPAPAA